MATEALSVVAEKAMDMARDIVCKYSPGRVTKKGERDMATEVDYKVEDTLRSWLSTETPEVAFLGEEKGETGINDGLKWVLDPVDGTANFLHGIPLCGISLALVKNGKPEIGVIDLPFLGLRYSASQGNGAFCNGRSIEASGTRALQDAIVSIGDYAVGEGSERRNKVRVELTRQLAGRVLRVRMFGSAATDLSWVADGRTSAAVILSNKPWDMAAGVIIAREAGALVLDWDGSDHTVDSAATVAVAPGVAAEIVAMVRGLHADRATDSD